MKSRFSYITPVALAIVLLCSSAAYAQTAAPPDQRQTKVEQRIRDMHASLHITKDQETEWDAFAQVMLGNAQAMDTAVRHYGGDRAGLSAPQILDNYAAISDQHARNVERLSSAMEVLYANLSPEQKQAADALFRKEPQKKAEEKK